VHGIAYTLHADKTPDILYPIGDLEDRARLQRLLKGLEDVNANIDSEEASEFKQMLGQLGPDEVKPLLEDISKYGGYCHGTHVAGIAVRGNPLARILTARITFPHTLIPEKPTLEQARKDSTMFLEVVEYFRSNGVRLVNMSWGGSLASIEAELEANTEGESPEERKKLAREIYEIQKAGLLQAFASAPEILFVIAAGNSDNDVRFEEFYPSSFDLPNILSVGAVDQAGDETDFTSFGKVDVYACGFEVDSFVPGGDRMKLSGTSQASPNVTNLAGKLLALEPELEPAELIELITRATEERQAGERSVRLIHPRKSVELLGKRM
jgi:subtilisin family serine protease